MTALTTTTHPTASPSPPEAASTIISDKGPDPFALSLNVLSTILSAPVPYSDAAQEKLCRSILHRLTPEELEGAALTSYAYWVASNSPSGSELQSLATDQSRETAALRAIRRHAAQRKLEGADADGVLAGESEGSFRAGPERAETVLPKKERRERRGRKGSSGVAHRGGYEDAADAAPGVDSENRAVVLKYPRTSAHFDEDGYVLAHMYIAERAIAATEIRSLGRQETVVAVSDFANYGQSFRPPFSGIRRLAGEMQGLYPERLESLAILDPPFWMRALVKLIQPFLDPDTQTKMRMPSGSEAEELRLMGKGEDSLIKENLLPREDVKQFLGLPFHRSALCNQE
eukprot:CAMPEP_0183327426 /NCGR_PEP_ID=MMETSP0160_2-20130417/83757_1 /TAXON_ID=2839 ORGANISM="Odontella Sinensis, Strain Grunow 1884" /NCGR_SAMPLE_ID=MMETSP0160_2 /ASSEMBLY_ACC=CAM_ASM_000250 /LENGTH=343 /DNA_ID=CAMNT_0025495553 /DNA_START=20 /DNA_END=1052 /DNA_ORIENTATION=-